MTSPYQEKTDVTEKSSDVVWHNATVTNQQRAELKKQKPVVLWFTGLSGSGKSTVANAVESQLLALGKHSYLLDGDNVRHGLNSDLGFSDEDRVENIRRIGEVAKLFVDSGSIVLTAFISPFISDRQQVRDLLDEGQFLEVFIDTPLEVCESRDPKGLYKKARSGEIKNFTGISSDYEAPVNPEIHVKTAECSVEECAKQVVDKLIQSNYF
ncbi:adenylyl-sulfate kinase [Vibrio owensii]|uniref:Adenylyl-sulfate kinase n=1 Tax=Vibrio owensii TaxID=696485 RepID=A0AAP9GGL1_9VIBR|nr:adenylyl-sulfate kinase [Vibrio owensii]AYO17480.1 adenylyl-sulfate kinase [Vibrio owensii]QGH49622.1 adenylyl-sulfate kinase [Vibrio owensii]